MPDDMDVLRLIEEVQKRPALWDVSYAEYKDRTNTPQQWQEIADLLGIDVDHCKRKWKNLRDAFRAEVRRAERRIQCQKNFGEYDPKAGHLTSKWIYFAPMRFINETRRPRSQKVEFHGRFTPAEACGNSRDAAREQDNSPNTYNAAYENYDDIKMEPCQITDDDDDNDKLFEEFETVATPQAARRLSDCIAERDLADASKLEGRSCKCPRTDDAQVHFLECLEREEQKLMQSTRQDISRFDTLSHVGDSDYNFLVSFLPQMKKMTELQNLHFRAKMSELLLNTMMSPVSAPTNPITTDCCKFRSNKEQNGNNTNASVDAPAKMDCAVQEADKEQQSRANPMDADQTDNIMPETSSPNWP